MLFFCPCKRTSQELVAQLFQMARVVALMSFSLRHVPSLSSNKFKSEQACAASCVCVCVGMGLATGVADSTVAAVVA